MKLILKAMLNTLKYHEVEIYLILAGLFIFVVPLFHIFNLPCDVGVALNIVIVIILMITYIVFHVVFITLEKVKKVFLNELRKLKDKE